MNTAIYKENLTTSPLPPVIPGLPLLGNVQELFQDPLMFMIRCYQEYGSIYRARALNLELTILAGPEANQFVTHQGKDCLTVRDVYVSQSIGMKSDHFLLNHDGEKHRELRKVLRRGYSKTALAPFIPTLLQLTQNMVRAWKNNERVLVVPAMKRLITSQLGQVLLQYDPEEYFQDLQTFFTITAETSTSHQLPMFVLKLPKFRRAQARLFHLVDEVIASHQATPEKSEHRTLIDDVLEAVDADGKPYPPDFLRAAIIGTYIAGIDTVALTCSFAVYALLKHPYVWERVAAEVRSVFSQTQAPTMQDFKRMKVLHAAVLEVLRYYPVGPGMPRTAATAFEFAGYRVPKGANVLVGTAVTHFLPQFFPDPFTFDIDRYLEPRHEHHQANVFVPFTIGEHTCLGAGMAEIQVMATMAALVNEIDLQLDPSDFVVQYKNAPSRGPKPNLAVRVKQLP
ncbi:MAG TPA: cytochrome P450 [Ktedonobacteraceae bacterium]|nr:cytochrome P450 [Ktedonobacteraceae bacterium]